MSGLLSKVKKNSSNNQPVGKNAHPKWDNAVSTAQNTVAKPNDVKAVKISGGPYDPHVDLGRFRNSSERDLSKLADSHLSWSALQTSISFLYKASIQAAADETPKDRTADYNFARTNFKNQLAAFLKEADQACSKKEDCKQVDVAYIIAEKINSAKSRVFGDMTFSVSSDLHDSRTKYERKDDSGPVTPSKDEVDFNAFTAGGNNLLTKKAIDEVNSRNTASGGALGPLWDWTFGFIFGPINQPKVPDSDFIREAVAIANKSVTSVEDDIKSDMKEAINNSSFAKPDGKPTFWLKPYEWWPHDDGVCFVAGTQITMNNGETRNIEDMEVGDEIRSYNELDQSGYISTVAAVRHHKPVLDELHRFTLSDGTTFTSSRNHPIYVPQMGCYLSAASIKTLLTLGQAISLQTERGDLAEIASVEVEEKAVPLFNLLVEGVSDVHPHWPRNGVGYNYFANGVLVRSALKSESVSNEADLSQVEPDLALAA